LQASKSSAFLTQLAAQASKNDKNQAKKQFFFGKNRNIDRLHFVSV